MKTKFGIAILLGGSLVAGNATADESQDPIERYGLSLTLGGGVGDFTGDEMRATTAVGGRWDVRAAIGTKQLLAFEAGYTGSAQPIDAIGLDTNAVLLGTSLQGAGRVNLGYDQDINPFFYAGLGWRRYDLANVDTNTSDVTDYDNLLEVPVGLGVSFRYQRFVADLRGEVRFATFEDMIPSADRPGEEMRMHTVGASAQLGYQF